MNLLNDFYRIESADRGQSESRYSIRLDAGHRIYAAHFPGEPITPGVCILQIGVELLSDAVGCRLDLSVARNVKFLSILRPDGRPVSVLVHKIALEGDSVKAQVEVSVETTLIAKMSLVCLKAAR